MEAKECKWRNMFSDAHECMYTKVIEKIYYEFQIPGILPTEEEDIDEMDDIDKVRDDLQSTKQLLAIELR